MPNDLPKRKNTRLANFDYSQAGCYFVTICTRERRCVLSRVVGGDAHIAPHIALTQLGKTVDKYVRSTPRIDKYCVMPNHIHFIIKIESGPMWASAPTQALPQRIRSLKTLVSKEVGASFFQRGYYDHIIRNEEDYQRIWQYVDDNPAKWAEDEYYSES